MKKSTPSFKIFNHPKRWLFTLCCLMLLSSFNVVQATHFRYGHLTWQRLSPTGNNVRFTLVDAFRRNGYAGTAIDGSLQIGDVFSETIGGTSLIFGDGTFTPVLNYKVIAFDVAENWVLAQALDPADATNTKTTVDHTYPSSTDGGIPWLAEINTNARTGVEQNNPNGNYRLLTYVETASGNRSPASSLPAIVNLVQSAASTFFVPGVDADPNTTLTFRLATALEAGNGSFNQPTGLTIDPVTGLVTWNTLVNAILGGLYSCQVIIEDRDAITGALRTQVAVDFLIEIVECTAVNTPPAFTAPSPACGNLFNVNAGQLLTFTVNAEDGDSLDVVDLNSGGLPAGATMNPSLPVDGNPVSSVFSWTPVAADAGAYVVTYTATDECGATAICSYSIIVTAPTCTIPTVKLTSTKTTCSYSCNATATANPSGGTSPYTYLWSNGQTAKTATGLCKGPYSVTVTDANGCTKNVSCIIGGPSPVKAASFTCVNVKCKGSCTGSLTVNPTGGSGTGYTYFWSNGQTTKTISNLCAGTYTVTITDSKGCTGTSSKTVTQPSKSVAVSVTKTACTVCPPNCNGTATANPTNGVAPYTYAWSTGAITKTITNLCAGTYTVTVTDKNGCTAVCQATIVGTCCTISLNHLMLPNTNCTPCNGSIVLSPSGGSGLYNYQWSNGSTSSSINGLCPGSYTVTVTDQQNPSCSSTATYDVTGAVQVPNDPNLVTIFLACHDDCTGGAELLNEFEYTEFLWSTGATTGDLFNACAGVYTLTVTAPNGCTATGGVNIPNPSEMIASCSVVSNESSPGANNGELHGSASGGLNPQTYDYSWSNGQTTQNATGLTAGNYTLIVTSGYGCIDTTECSITTEETCNGDFTTYTQGGWGNSGAPGQYMAANFENCFGSIMVGHPCGFAVTLTTVQAVQDFLPQGSTAAALTQSYTDPGSGNITVLAGQVLGVMFALGFDDCDPNLSGSSSDLGDQLYVKSGSPFFGWSIQAISDTARRILAGCPSNYTPAQVNEATTDVNENYDEGADGGLFVCPQNYNAPRFSSSSVSYAGKRINVYPSPFSDVLNIDLISDEELSIKVTDVTGRVLRSYSNINHSIIMEGKWTDGVYFVNIENQSGSYREVIKVVRSN